MSWHCVFSHSRSTKVLPFVTGWVSGVVCGIEVGSASYFFIVAVAPARAEFVDVDPETADVSFPELLLHAAAARIDAMMLAVSIPARYGLRLSMVRWNDIVSSGVREWGYGSPRRTLAREVP